MMFVMPVTQMNVFGKSIAMQKYSHEIAKAVAMINAKRIRVFVLREKSLAPEYIPPPLK